MDELVKYLREWVADAKREGIVQLDGSLVKVSNRDPAILFKIPGRILPYFLPQDCKRDAIERFITKYDSAQNGSGPLVENKGYAGLLIEGEMAPNGWYCYEAPVTQFELRQLLIEESEKTKKKKKAA